MGSEEAETQTAAPRYGEQPFGLVSPCIVVVATLCGERFWRDALKALCQRS